MSHSYKRNVFMFKQRERLQHVLCEEVLQAFLYSVWGFITLKLYNYEKKLIIGFCHIGV